MTDFKYVMPNNQLVFVSRNFPCYVTFLKDSEGDFSSMLFINRLELLLENNPIKKTIKDIEELLINHTRTRELDMDNLESYNQSVLEYNKLLFPLQTPNG